MGWIRSNSDAKSQEVFAIGCGLKATNVILNLIQDNVKLAAG